MEKTYIEEVQSFQWLPVVPGLVAVLFGILCFFQIGLKRPMGNHPAPDWVLILIFIITIACTILFIFQKLRTSITDQAIYISFGIFAFKRVIPLVDIANISIRKYDGINEFWGWGVKSNAHEKCYTVSGDDGIEIELKKPGKKILIGTQKPGDMQAVINKDLAVH